MTLRERKQPTLKTISALSGLAVPTVSRALNDAPDIGVETKERVKRIAREIGYVPNRAGVRLKTGKTSVISVILSTEHDMMNHTARLISSVAGGLRDTRYHLIITPYFPSEDPMKPVRYVVENGTADAVILNQIEPEDERIRYLIDRGFPFATHGRTRWCEKHHYFDYDNHAFGRLAVARMARRGRRRVLMILPPMSQHYAIHTLAGAREAGAETGTEIVPSEGWTSDSKGEAILEEVARLLAGDAAIDGIVCSSPTAVIAAVGAIERAGRRLGADIDVTGKQAVRFLDLLRPEIDTASEDAAAAGEFLARAAIQAIEEPAAPPMQKLDVPTEASFSRKI